MATVTSTPTAGSLTVSGTTQKSGTISWSSPTVPSGATITSCVLTGTATAAMSKGSATITVNGSSVTSGQTFTVNLGTANTTTYVATTAKGSNKNAAGTVSFSNLVYTVTYEEPSTQAKNILHINSNNDWGYVVETISGQTYTGTSITIEKNYLEDIDVMIYPNEGYVIANVYDPMFGDDPGSFTQYPYGIQGAVVGSSGVEYTIVVTYEKIDSESEESPADKNRLIFTSNIDAGYVVVNRQNYTGTNIIVDLDFGEDIIVEVHANDGYIIDTVVDPIYGSTETVSGPSWIPAEIGGSLFNQKWPDLNYIITYKENSGLEIIEWTGTGTVATGLFAYSQPHSNYKINLNWENECFDIVVVEGINYNPTAMNNTVIIGDVVIGENKYYFTNNEGCSSVYLNNEAIYESEEQALSYPTLRFNKDGIHLIFEDEVLLIAENIYETNQPIYFYEDNEPYDTGDYDLKFDLVVSEYSEEPDLTEPVDGYIAKNLVSYGDWSYTFNVDWDTQYLDIEVLNYSMGLFATDYYYRIINNSYTGNYSHESASDFTIHDVIVESDREDIDIIRYSKVDGVCIISSNGTQIIPGNSFANDTKTTIEAVIPGEWLESQDGFMTFNIKITDIASSEEPIQKTRNLVIRDEIINQLFIGEQEIQEIYLGDNLLFKK